MQLYCQSVDLGHCCARVIAGGFGIWPIGVIHTVHVHACTSITYLCLPIHAGAIVASCGGSAENINSSNRC